jgi:hypothetical protein
VLHFDGNAVSGTSSRHRTYRLSTGPPRHNLDGRINFHGVAVENRWFIAPLAGCFHSSIDEFWRPTYRFELRDISVTIDNSMNHHRSVYLLVERVGLGDRIDVVSELVRELPPTRIRTGFTFGRS